MFILSGLLTLATVIGVKWLFKPKQKCSFQDVNTAIIDSKRLIPVAMSKLDEFLMDLSTSKNPSTSNGINFEQMRKKLIKYKMTRYKLERKPTHDEEQLIRTYNVMKIKMAVLKQILQLFDALVLSVDNAEYVVKEDSASDTFTCCCRYCTMTPSSGKPCSRCARASDDEEDID